MVLSGLPREGDPPGEKDTPDPKAFLLPEDRLVPSFCRGGAPQPPPVSQERGCGTGDFGSRSLGGSREANGKNN